MDMWLKENLSQRHVAKEKAHACLFTCMFSLTEQITVCSSHQLNIAGEKAVILKLVNTTIPDTAGVS